MKRWMFGFVIVAVVGLSLPASGQPLKTCAKSFQDCIDDMLRDLTARGWFGMLLGNSEMTPEGEPIPEDLKILVYDVIADGPADAGGFKTGDVVLEVNGKPYRDLDVLNPVRETMKVGDVISLTVSREGEKKELKLTLGEPPATTVALWLGKHIETNYLVVKDELVQ